MIAQCDVIKFATALTASSTTHLPSTLSPEEARAWLDAPAHLDPGQDRGFGFGLQEIPPRSTAFVNRVTPHLPIDELRSDNPEAWTTYKHSLQRVIDVAPDGLNLCFGNPMCDLDDAAVALWSAAWFAEVRLGAALEHARLALTSTLRIWPVCLGYGCARGEAPGERMVRVVCAGAGTLPAVFGYHPDQHRNQRPRVLHLRPLA